MLSGTPVHRSAGVGSTPDAAKFTQSLAIDAARARSASDRTAHAGNRRFWLLSALCAHTKAPYKTDLHRKMLMALNRPETARTVGGLVEHERELAAVTDALAVACHPTRAPLPEPGSG
jgi:hypothetical protein